MEFTRNLTIIAQAASLTKVLGQLLQTTLNFIHGNHTCSSPGRLKVSGEIYAKLIWSVTVALALATSAGQVLTSKA